MNKAYLFSGLPGSGKSTLANKMVKKDPRLVIISADEIGQMLKGSYPGFSCTENYHAIRLLTLKIVQDIVKRAIDENLNFIIDETLRNREHRVSWIKFIHAYCCLTLKSYKIILGIFHSVDVETCLKNRMKNPKGLSEERWQEIITRMAETWNDCDYRDHNDAGSIQFEMVRVEEITDQMAENLVQSVG